MLLGVPSRVEADRPPLRLLLLLLLLVVVVVVVLVLLVLLDVIVTYIYCCCSGYPLDPLFSPVGTTFAQKCLF